MRQQLRGYPFDHTGQYFAGTTFHHVADAMLLYALHGFYPPNRAKRLPEKRIAYALRFGFFGDIDVVDDRDFGRSQCQWLQVAAQALRSWLHHGAMEWRGNR